MRLGEKIKELRENKNLTQLQLSKLSGIHITYIRYYEDCVFIPSMKKLSKITQALQVSLKEFQDVIPETDPKFDAIKARYNQAAKKKRKKNAKNANRRRISRKKNSMGQVGCGAKKNQRGSTSESKSERVAGISGEIREAEIRNQEEVRRRREAMESNQTEEQRNQGEETKRETGVDYSHITDETATNSRGEDKADEITERINYGVSS